MFLHLDLASDRFGFTVIDCSLVFSSYVRHQRRKDSKRRMDVDAQHLLDLLAVMKPVGPMQLVVAQDDDTSAGW